ncbi:MAG: hypothetical protein EOL87_14900 [Spartobacteria bacterium]|nr:hypothetical protein [Spartobacteria bacterium]
MSKKNIGSILSQLKNSDRFKPRAAPRQADDSMRATSFGIPLRRTGEGCFCIDMTGIRTLTGIPEMVHILTQQFFEQCRTAASDIMVQMTVNSEITPELTKEGIGYVVLYVRCAIAKQLQLHRPETRRHVHKVISSLQSARVRDSLFASESTAWLFPFPASSDMADYFALLEHDVRFGFLRITIESKAANRLFLKRIPHRIVSEDDNPLYVQDIHKLSEKIIVGIHQACQNQREFYTEEPSRQPAVFELLSRTELSGLSLIHFSWNNQRMTRFLLGNDPEILELIAKTLMLIEDAAVLHTLAEYQLIELITNERRIYLDLSRRGACLNVSIDRHHRSVNIHSYLERMPKLHQTATRADAAMKKVRVVFIHHLTAETLGCIRAIQQMDCAFFHGLFIRYKGVTPDAYMDALLSLPEEQFIFHSLHNLGDQEHLQGHFVLSHQFSPISLLHPLTDDLRTTPHDYFSAMRKTSCHIFFRQIIEAKAAQQKVLLIEDGGYVAPLINQWAKGGITVKQALARCSMSDDGLPESDLAGPLATWLQDAFLSSVEHTRNGYDQLRDVINKCDGLTFPAYTMAISDYKNVEEGRGAAMSIIAACEVIMNGQGDSIYCRHGMVIGSRGNIGRFLLKQLSDRTASNQRFGIDAASSPEGRAMLCDAPEYTRMDDIPETSLIETDLVIGVTGHSVFQPESLRTMILKGTKQRIYLASGSTKNLEFAAVITWLQTIRNQSNPKIDDYPVRVETVPVLDPLTEVSQGTRIRIHFTGETLPPGIQKNRPYKDILLLADGMPLNFNFYGVPSEIIDQVMQQLIQMCLLGVSQPMSDTPPEPDLYVLDFTIDANGNPLTGRILP